MSAQNTLGLSSLLPPALVGKLVKLTSFTAFALFAPLSFRSLLFSSLSFCFFPPLSFSRGGGTVAGAPGVPKPQVPGQDFQPSNPAKSAPALSEILLLHFYRQLQQYFQSQRYFVVLVAQKCSAIWGKTLAAALLYDQNQTIPFGLIVL